MLTLMATLALTSHGHVASARSALAHPQLHARTLISMSSPAEEYSLPDSFEDAADCCAQTIMRALGSGVSKARVDFDTSAGDITYTSLRQSMPIARALMLQLAEKLCVTDEASGQPAGKLQILLPDEGTAALLAREWSPPPTVRTACLARYRLPDDAAACIVVAPTALDTKALDTLLSAEPIMSGDVPVVVLNPQMVDLSTGALGLEGRNMLKRMASEFQDVFVLQTLHGAAITRAYPGKYVIWQEDAAASGGFKFVRDDTKRPTPFSVAEELYEDTSTPGFLKEMGQFIRGLQRL
jgi:hypothetical protein